MAPQPIPESALLTGPLEKTNEAYAVAKIAGLKMCEFFRKQYGVCYHSAMPTNLYGEGDTEGIKALEKELLAQNAEHKDWTCSEEMMKLTKDGKALYLHCLPADITGLSCPEGEVDNSVFDRYLVPLYKQASYKPYIIAAMIFLAQVKDPVKALMDMDASDNKRRMF